MEKEASIYPSNLNVSDLQKVANVFKFIGKIINDLPANRLKYNIDLLQKYLALFSSPPKSPTEGACNFRLIMMHANEVVSAAQELASLCSTKEQNDFAVEQANQITEDYRAAIEGRPNIKIQNKISK